MRRAGIPMPRHAGTCGNPKTHAILRNVRKPDFDLTEIRFGRIR